MTHFIGLHNLDDRSSGSDIVPTSAAYTMEMQSMIGHPKKKITEEVIEVGPSFEKKPIKAPSTGARIKKFFRSIKNYVVACLIDPSFLAGVLFGLGSALLVIIFSLGAKALGTEEAVKYNFTWTRVSLPLLARPCGDLEWPLRLVSLAVNIFSTLVMVFSSTIQRLCTSPDLWEIRRELARVGDFEFGCNSPIAMIRRRRWGSLGVWLIMVTTSLPLHLLINAVFGQSNEFSSIEALAQQTETGVCRIVMRPWIGAVIALMTMLKAVVILMYVRYNDNLHREKYKNLGDIISAALGNPDLVQGLSSMEDTTHGVFASSRALTFKSTDGLPVSTYQVRTQPHKINRFTIKYVTLGEFVSLLGMMFMAAVVLIEVGVNYTAPQGSSIAKQIQVILAVNVPQFAFSGLLFLFQDIMTRWFLEREWRSYAKKSKAPRTSLNSSSTGMYGKTRSARLLTIPAWAAVATIVYSVICHFCVSQMQEIAEIYIQPSTIIMGFTWSAQRAAFIATLYCLPVLPVVLVVLMWTVPSRTRMPAMQGSGRVVLAACSHIATLQRLPDEGIRWGDLGEAPDTHPAVVRSTGLGRINLGGAVQTVGNNTSDHRQHAGEEREDGRAERNEWNEAKNEWREARQDEREEREGGREDPSSAAGEGGGQARRRTCPRKNRIAGFGAHVSPIDPDALYI